MSAGTGFWPSRRPCNSSPRSSPGWLFTSWGSDFSYGLLTTAGWVVRWSRPDQLCAPWASWFHTRAAGAALDPLAALAGLGTVALQIGYLPTLYAAFNRREALITMLDSRAGVPSWGPELLARTHYGLGSGVSAVGELPALFEAWEQWSADVSESHTTYVPLIWFRSPRPLSSWVTAQIAILDAAALYLALLPDASDLIQARLCLRGGFTCLGNIARAIGIPIPLDADPTDGISLSYEDFIEAIERLRRVNYPIERPLEEAWADFLGWRVNYEAAAYALAWATEAPPALWSGPRRHEIEQMAPLRPRTAGAGKAAAGGRPDRNH